MAIDSRDIEVIARQLTISNYLRIMERRYSVNEQEKEELEQITQVVMNDLNYY